MRYGTNTNLSSLLDQKVDILQLMHDEDSAAYAWTIRRTCPAYVETDIHDNLFSAAGTRARGAKITIRTDSRLTLHEAMRWNGKFLFLTSIELSEQRDRQELQAAVCESVTLTAKPQARTGRDALNRPSAVYVSVVPAAGTIATGFGALAAYTYDYIAGPPDISSDDATALAALVKERRKLRYIGKAVLPNTAADYEGVINFVSAGIAAGGKTAFSAAAYCSRIAGMLAGTPAQCSATYAQLSEVTGVTATENPDTAVDAGKLFIIDDGRVRKLSRAVTSKVTIGDTEPEALKKIKMTAAIDLIRYYAVSSVEDDYFGQVANTYDDKCVLLLAMQDYLKSLEDSKVLESGSSGAVLDADATRKYLITAAGDDATEVERIKKLSDNEVIKENTGSKVFLKLYGNIMDAMEDFAIVFEVSPSVIAA